MGAKMKNSITLSTTEIQKPMVVKRIAIKFPNGDKPMFVNMSATGNYALYGNLCDKIVYSPYKPGQEVYVKKAEELRYKIISVEIKQLQNISDDELIGEGLCSRKDINEKWGNTAKSLYGVKWDKALTTPQTLQIGWQANPWVWKIRMEPCNKNKVL